MTFIKPDWPAPVSIKAYTTSKQAWGGRHTEQDTQSAFYTSNTAEEDKLKTLLQLPEKPLWLKQTHSAIALEATPENFEKNADASFTSTPNRVCVVLTADCLPILICNQQGSVVSAIHAGWRGLANGVIEATLDKMQQPENELLVWLGPAIGPNKFEVGADVYDAFTLKQPESASAFVPYTEGKWLADLYALARIRLKSRGITQIYGGEYCTFSQEDLFFSYRRDKGKTGRMASLIWINK